MPWTSWSTETITLIDHFDRNISSLIASVEAIVASKMGRLGLNNEG